MRRPAQVERARATRARIVAAATPLFVRDGYLATTMSGIARAAGVAVQTLYLSFGSKIAVLEAALGARADPDEQLLRDEPDGLVALARHVAATVAAIEFDHPLGAVLRDAAADPEPAELLRRTRRAALAAHSRAVDELAEKPDFTDHISLQRATDIVAAMLSPEAYGLLVDEQGWTVADWSEWVLTHLRTDLYPASGDRTAAP